jgi:N-acetylmuramic acid 6-phosphate etherase
MDKSFIRITESNSNYDHIENFSTTEILQNINAEDKKVAYAVEQVIPTIQTLVDSIVGKLSNGGRLFYIGAGTSGRLGLVDASECPPTFGVPNDLVIGIIAGGHQAMFQAVENAEDNMDQAWKDLLDYNISNLDVVIGIAASGTTPYVIGGLQTCRQHQITTGSISCNLNSPVSGHADFPIEVVVGPEFITGSTRMKSGTAQKMVLNMISTAVMIKLGRIKGNKMVNMQLTNQKLFDRGVKMIVDELDSIDVTKAAELLSLHGSVKKSIEAFQLK